jgi:hypothetical protein
MIGSPLMTGIVEQVPAVGIPGGIEASPPEDAPPPSSPEEEPLPLPEEVDPLPDVDVLAPELEPLVDDPLPDDVDPLPEEVPPLALVPCPEEDPPLEVEPLPDEEVDPDPVLEVEPHDALRTRATPAARAPGRVVRSLMNDHPSTKRTDRARSQGKGLAAEYSEAPRRAGAEPAQTWGTRRTSAACLPKQFVAPGATMFRIIVSGAPGGHSRGDASRRAVL